MFRSDGGGRGVSCIELHKTDENTYFIVTDRDDDAMYVNKAELETLMELIKGELTKP